jgi:hypothetical protein
VFSQQRRDGGKEGWRRNKRALQACFKINGCLTSAIRLLDHTKKKEYIDMTDFVGNWVSYSHNCAQSKSLQICFLFPVLKD